MTFYTIPTIRNDKTPKEIDTNNHNKCIIYIHIHTHTHIYIYICVCVCVLHFNQLLNIADIQIHIFRINQIYYAMDLNHIRFIFPAYFRYISRSQFLVFIRAEALMNQQVATYT